MAGMRRWLFLYGILAFGLGGLAHFGCTRPAATAGSLESSPRREAGPALPRIDEVVALDRHLVFLDLNRQAFCAVRHPAAAAPHPDSVLAHLSRPVSWKRLALPEADFFPREAFAGPADYFGLFDPARGRFALFDSAAQFLSLLDLDPLLPGLRGEELFVGRLPSGELRLLDPLGRRGHLLLEAFGALQVRHTLLLPPLSGCLEAGTRGLLCTDADSLLLFDAALRLLAKAPFDSLRPWTEGRWKPGAPARAGAPSRGPGRLLLRRGHQGLWFFPDRKTLEAGPLP